jgi:hypothetical protein
MLELELENTFPPKFGLIIRHYKTITVDASTLNNLGKNNTLARSGDIKKVKLSLCLTKHHAMKMYWGVEV